MVKIFAPRDCSKAAEIRFYANKVGDSDMLMKGYGIRKELQKRDLKVVLYCGYQSVVLLRREGRHRYYLAPQVF